MTRHLPLNREEAKALTRAQSLILDEVLPRLLRVASDPEASGEDLLRAIQRRLDHLKNQGRSAVVAEAIAAQIKVHQIVESAVRDETRRRLPDLGTDGTP